MQIAACCVDEIVGLGGRLQHHFEFRCTTDTPYLTLRRPAPTLPERSDQRRRRRTYALASAKGSPGVFG
jgi:hypothetical protein